MRKSVWRCLVVGSCCGLSFVFFKSVRLEPLIEISTDSTQVDDGTGEDRLADRGQRDELDSDQFYDPDRGMRDREYAMKARRHNRIRQYLNAPRRGDPNYERVLHTLLRNGFGIEDWVTTISNISEWYMPFHMRRSNLELRGESPEAIEKNLEEFAALRRRDYELIKESILHDVGVADDNVLEELMAIPIVMENGEAPFGHGSYDIYEGDRILTDEDWMSPAHHATSALYQGAPRERLTELERISWYRKRKAEQLGLHLDYVPALNRDYVSLGILPSELPRSQGAELAP